LIISPGTIPDKPLGMVIVVPVPAAVHDDAAVVFAGGLLLIVSTPPEIEPLNGGLRYV
jgi:hypothetical protein